MKHNLVLPLLIALGLFNMIKSTETQVTLLNITILVSPPMFMEMRRPALPCYLRPSLRASQMPHLMC